MTLPKILNGIEQNILEEARRQVLEQGYSRMTIRSVARACGIAVGTIYNYYSSKEVLTASFMLSDWFALLQSMGGACAAAAGPGEAFRCVYDGLQAFADRYKRALFTDRAAEKSYAAALNSRHGQLRAQVAELLAPVCAGAAVPSPALPEFIADALLTWALEEKPFDELSAILLQLFKK